MAWQWSNPQPSGNNLVKVAFQDSVHGLIVADNGEVSETSDGGETWRSRGGRIDNDYLITAAVLDARTILSLSGFGQIWRTADGGATWAVAGSFSNFLVQIGDCGDGVVLAVGMGGTTIVRSADRGATWKQVLEDADGPYLVGIHCEGRHAFAVGDSGRVFRSRDQGMHWESLASPLPGSLTGVAFADSTHGFVTTSRGRLAETLDGGSTWKLTVLDSLNYLVEVLRQGARWRVIGSGGGIWTSKDNGSTWIRSDSLTSLYLASAAFAGSSGGIAIGNNGLILKEVGQGGAWKIIRKGPAHFFDGMAMFSTSSWLAFGSPGRILRTTDAGATWRERPMHPDTTRYLAGSCQGSRGLLSGHDGTIALSRDGGETWVETETPRRGLRLYGVAWSGSGEAVAVGDSAALWRTVDTGRTWQEIPPPRDLGTRTLSAVSFRNDSVGVAVGAHGVVLATGDGGTSWTRLSLGLDEGYSFGVAWLGGDTALAVGDWGHGWYLRLTADAGVTWAELPLPTRKWLWAVTGLGGGRAVLTGQDGAILVGTLQRGDSGAGKPNPPPGDGGTFSVRRTGSPGQILIQVNLSFVQRVSLAAYSMDGRSLGIIYRGTLGAGSHSLRLPYARRGLTVFRMEGMGSESRFSRTKLLPY